MDFGDFGFWSLGFWILVFGFSDKFWILHNKKKTVHSDPGRRIEIPTGSSSKIPTVDALGTTRNHAPFWM